MEKTHGLPGMLFWDQGRFAANFLGLGMLGLLFYKKTQLEHPALPLFIIFSGGFLAFGALNVYMDRYLMVLFPISAIGIAFLLDKVCLEEIEGRWTTLFKIGLGVSLILASWFNISQAEFRFDVDINYRDYVWVQKEATEYLEDQIPPQEAFLANFPLFNGFQDPRFGFAKDTLHNTAWVVPHESMEYRALLTPPEFAKNLPKKGKRIQVFERGFTQVEIYQKND